MSELGKYELPPGWRWATIPDLVGDDGVFCDGDWIESEDQDPNGDVRLVQLADVGDGNYRDRSARFLTTAKAAELRCTFLEPGDVLIARMPDPLGRACVFPGDVKPSVTAVDVCIVRSRNGKFEHRWLTWFVNAPPFRAAVAGLQAGSTRKRISRKNLGTIPLPLPPLNEQRRIVAEIEKQFTRLEAGVVGLRRVQSTLKRYRAAVLKAACEGRLVPTEAELACREGRIYETGAQLLERILTERRQKWTVRGKYKEPAAPDASNLPPLPEGWTWGILEAITDALGGFAFESKKFSDSGFQILKMANVRMGRIDLTQKPSFIREVEPEVVAKYKLVEGDVVVTLTGSRKKEDYGYVAVVKGRTSLLLNQRIALLRSTGGVIPTYSNLRCKAKATESGFSPTRRVMSAKAMSEWRQSQRRRSLFHPSPSKSGSWRKWSGG